MKYMATLLDKAFDLAIVDPPYGINAGNVYSEEKKLHGNSAALRNGYKIKWDDCTPSEEYFNELIRVSKNHIIWGLNYYKIQYKLGSGRIFWDKDNGDNDFSDGEIAYQSFTESVRKVKITWNGMIQYDMKNKEERIHPTQKPIKLYKWLLKNYANEGDKILDTHLGSGSSAIAAHQMGFDFVGCEIDKDYYDAACKRFKEQTMQQSIF
ncbi:MAG: site-specific DNA-methyltransferase [Bacteroidetes bacterium]|nr:site-specific DNA-methyltransferase [Bacteroidota bacterium]